MTFFDSWTAVNATERVSAYHAREYAHSRGAFSAWKTDEPRRRRYMRALVQAIRVLRPTPIAAVVDAEGARGLSRAAQTRMRDPYCHCVQAVLRAAAIEAMDRPRQETVRMVVAKSKERTGDVIKLWTLMRETSDYRHRIGELVLDDAKNLPGLQAADLWAYELQKEIERRGEGRSRRSRYPWHLFEWLMYPAPMVRYFSARELAAIYGDGT